MNAAIPEKQNRKNRKTETLNGNSQIIRHIVQMFDP
jgi:hypothetical protein